MGKTRWCVCTVLLVVIIASIFLISLPETAKAWYHTKVYVNLRIHNRYWWVTPPPNDLRVMAAGWRGGWYHPRVQWEWTNYYPNHWWYYWWLWTVKKFGYRDTPYCRWVWACTAFQVRPWSWYYVRWDWTRNSSYYLRGRGLGWRFSSPAGVFLPNNLPVISDSTTTNMPPPDSLATFARVDSVQWANSPVPIDIQDLTLTGTAGLSWTAPNPSSPVQIFQGDTLFFPDANLMAPPDGQRTVVLKGKFQSNADDPDSLGHWTNFVMQIHLEKIPTLSPVGMVILVAVLIAVASLLIMIRKRRALEKT